MTNNTPLDTEEVALWRGFLRWTESITSQVEQALTASTGLSAAEFQILLRLQEAGGTLPQSTLQADLGWTATRVSHQLARTEQRGHLHRRPTGAGRAKQIELHTSGTAVLGRARGPHAAAVRHHLLEPLRDDQRRALLELGQPAHPDTSRPEP